MLAILNALFPVVLEALKTTTAAAPQTTTIQAKPSDAIRQLQRLINQFAPPTPPLKEDGWLGPKTEAAILTAVARLSPFLGVK